VQRSDDFLEARLAAEQAPLGQEIQLSVVNNPEPERPVAVSMYSQASSFSPIQAAARAKYSIYRGGFLVSAVRDRTPGDMTEADIDDLRAEGWTDPQIVATVHVTGIFAYMNRVAEAFGLTPAPPPRSARAGGGGAKAYCHAIDDRTGGAIECPCTGNGVKDPYASA